MKHFFCTVIWFLLVAFPSAAQAAHVNVIELDNQIISPVTQQYIVSAIERSERDGAQGLILVLDTPGGLLESTRAIVKRIMNAKVPVAVYVAPSGSRAGSAGAFITLAAHVAAMAPSTNIGAAHPVMLGKASSGGKEEKPDKPLEDKAANDAAATTISRRSRLKDGIPRKPLMYRSMVAGSGRRCQ